MADFQYTYNGWTFGDGTNFTVMGIDGLGLPDILSANPNLAAGDGTFPGIDFYSFRAVRFRIEVDGDTDNAFEASVDEMRRATVKQASELPLTFDLPGQTVKRLNCRPSRRRAPIDVVYTRRRAKVDLEFVASDPLFYEDTGTNTVITTATAVTNAGDTTAGWTAAITGATNPKLTHVGSGLFLDFSADGGLSGAVDIVSNARAHTALQAGINKYGKLTATSEFFELGVGANSLTYTGGGACTVTHRAAYAALV